MTNGLFSGIRIYTLDRRYIQRRRHIIYNGIQQLLYALVLIRSSAYNRNHGVGNGRLSDASLDFVDGDFFACEILFHQCIILLSNVFHQGFPILSSLFLHILRNFFYTDIFSKVIVVYISLHFNQVDYALELIFSTDRQLNRNSITLQSVVHHFQNTIEVCAHDVHLVDISHSRNLVLISLSPNCFGLWLYAALCTEYCNRTIQYTQGTFYFYSEVYVSRGIDNVDSVTCPISSGCSRGNGNTSFLFLLHPVHGSSTLVGFTDLMIDTGVKQDTFCGCGFTSVDVSHNADVSCFL